MTGEHKHCKEIIAWAKGFEIEYYDSVYDRWKTANRPSWDVTSTYRVKPQAIIRYYDFIDGPDVLPRCISGSIPHSLPDNNILKVEFDINSKKIAKVDIL